MKITKQHIENLYQFTRQHYVEYYDVQTELVDHLANEIEVIWEENPNLTFEEARDQSFKKFGVFGFMDIVEAKAKQMNKKYYRILWGFLKEWFTIPKLVVTISLIFFFYKLMALNISESYLFITVLIFGITDVVLVAKLSKKAKKRFQAKGKKYLLEDVIFKVGASTCVVVFSTFFQFSTFLENIESPYWKLFFATLITLLILYSYISLLFIPKKADMLLINTYPEYQ